MIPQWIVNYDTPRAKRIRWFTVEFAVVFFFLRRFGELISEMGMECTYYCMYVLYMYLYILIRKSALVNITSKLWALTYAYCGILLLLKKYVEATDVEFLEVIYS